MADRQAPGKGNGVKSEPLWGQNKTIVFAQAQPEDVVELWRVMQAAYAEFQGKLDHPRARLPKRQPRCNQGLQSRPLSPWKSS